MKSKAKLKKVKSKTSGPNIPRDWFYMSKEKASVRELFNIVTQSASYEAEIWEDAGILEVSIGEKASMDFEEGVLDFEDEYSLNFIKEKGVSSLYYVSFPNTSYDQAKELMALIIEKSGGLFCADTEDFSPVIE